MTNLIQVITTGTQIIWADTTDYLPAARNNLGSRTHQIDMTSLAVGAYRQGAKANMGTTRAGKWQATVSIEPTGTPAAAGNIQLWLAFSHSSVAGTGNPGNTTGADANWFGHGAASSDGDELIEGLEYIGQFPLSNDAAIFVGHVGIVLSRKQYVMPVLRNNGSVAFAADAVEMAIELSPIDPRIENDV